MRKGQTDRAVIETVDGNRRALTVVGTNGVYYSVEKLVDLEWVTVWEQRVFFGRDKAHQAGGYAFVQAASEQERQLN